MAFGPVTLSLARRAARFPDRTAVVDISEERLYAPAETVHENRVSYDDLSTLVDGTAERLSTRGIEAGDTVCLVTRNRVASLAMLFACRRLGATFAPISHLLTPVTVERPFDVLDPALVVAESAQRDLVRSMPFDRTVTLSELAETNVDADAEGATVTASGSVTLGGEAPSDVDGAADPTDGGDTDESTPLLVLHGEGGRPVVEYSARALEWNCIAAMVTWGLSADDTVPLVTPLSAYDGLIRVALPVLYAGGQLLLDRAFDPGDALTAIETEDATLLSGRTGAFRDIAAESGFPDAASSIERAIPDASVPDDVLDTYRVAGIPTARAYGRLECPIAFGQEVASAADVDEDVADIARTATAIGRPVLDCRARLLVDGGGDGDGNGNGAEGDDWDVLDGAGTGRLALSGPVLADGYVDEDGARNSSADGGDGFGTGDRTNEDPIDTGHRGRFANGWFDAPETAERNETGRYSLLDTKD